ncbi:hypothetical protein [Ekhidna sp.]
MSHKLQDITLYYPQSSSAELKKKFAGISHVVTDLYVHFLDSYKPPKTSRISVTLGHDFELINYSGSVLTMYHTPFEGEEFWKLSEQEQKLQILEITHEVTRRCCDKFDWDRNVFETAYKKVIEVDFRYEIELKHKLSPNRKKKACLTLEKNGKCAIISALLMNVKGERINKVELFRLPQNEMFYGTIIKRNKWFGDEFGVYDSDEELQILADSDSTERIVKFFPNKHSQEQLEKVVIRLTCPEINSRAEFEAWIKGELSPL